MAFRSPNDEQYADHRAAARGRTPALAAVFAAGLFAMTAGGTALAATPDAQVPDAQAPALSAAAAPLPWTATATSALAHVQVLNVLPVADVTLGPAAATADSSKGAGAATARGANLDALALGAISLTGILTDISQSSTPNTALAPASGVLLAVPLAPIATAGVGTATASAQDISSGACPTNGAPVSGGVSNVAGAAVLPALAGLGDAVNVAQTVSSTGSVVLTPSANLGVGNSVTSTATSSLTQISLLGGTVVIGVAHAPTLTAVATGTSTGSSVTYTAPVITVTIAGTTQTLSAPGQDIPIPGLGDLSLGAVTQTVAPNGTSVTASASLLHLDISPAGVQIATVDLVPETVSATAPAGGVLCAASTGGGGVVTPTPPPTPPANPFSEFHKDLSSTSVAAGQTFTSTIVVSNRSTCTVSDAVVTDAVKGDLTLVSATPSPTSSHSGSYVYGPLTLAPGQVIDISQTFRVPADATNDTEYGDTATIKGSCSGVPASGTSTITGPTVGSNGTGACDLKRSTLSSDHRDVVAGEEFNDLVNLFNAGGADCTDVTTTLKLPAGTTFVSCTASCTHTATTVTWASGTIKPGESKTLAVTLLAPATHTGNVNLGTTATVTSGSTKVSLKTSLPEFSGTSVLAPGDPATRGATKVKSAPKPPKQPTRVLAYTGGLPTAFPALLIVLFGAGMVVLRRRFR